MNLKAQLRVGMFKRLCLLHLDFESFKQQFGDPEQTVSPSTQHGD